MISLEAAIQQLAKLPTPAVSNAIDQQGIQSRVSGFSEPDLRCFFPELGIVSGVAVTVEIETMNAEFSGPSLGERFNELLVAIDSEAAPVIVVAKEVGTNSTFAAHCGEVIGSIIKRLGAVGLVTDAAIRDVNELRSLGLHCFAKGVTPSKGNARLVRTGVPMRVAGVDILPGDLLHGDANGVIKIPTQQRTNLLSIAKAVAESEKDLVDFINSGEFSLEKLRVELGLQNTA